MQTWPGTLLKKMVKAGEFSRKMETHLLLKRGIWFFFNTWFKTNSLKGGLGATFQVRPIMEP